MAASSACRVEDAFDWSAPDYVSILQARVDRLNYIRKNQSCMRLP